MLFQHRWSVLYRIQCSVIAHTCIFDFSAPCSLVACTMKVWDLCYTLNWMQQQRRLVGSDLETISSTTRMLSGKEAVVVHFSFMSFSQVFFFCEVSTECSLSDGRITVAGSGLLASYLHLEIMLFCYLSYTTIYFCLFIHLRGEGL